MARTCRSCGAELPAQAGRGRPRVFCGERCKRSAERATQSRHQRIGRLLVRLQGKLAC